MNEIEVKALEWTALREGDEVAESILGTYTITGGSVFFVWFAGQADYEDYALEAPSMEAAKAAAQADYEQRILSALTTSPTPPAASVTVGEDFTSDDDALEVLHKYGHREVANGVIRGDWRAFDATCRAAVEYLIDEWDFVFENEVEPEPDHEDALPDVMTKAELYSPTVNRAWERYQNSAAPEPVTVTEKMRIAACRALNERGQGNAVTICDVIAMLEAALSAPAAVTGDTEITKKRIAEGIIQSVCELQELPDLDHPETIVINVDDLRVIIENNLDRAERALSASPSPVDSRELIARPLSEWHEDDGFVTWWKFPVEEPSWIGTPNDDDWPGYHTHWTPHPEIPVQNDAALLAAKEQQP